MVEIDTNAMMFLKAYRPHLTAQQYKTLRGQALAGDAKGAMKGLKKILERGKDNEHENRRRSRHHLENENRT